MKTLKPELPIVYRPMNWLMLSGAAIFLSVVFLIGFLLNDFLGHPPLNSSDWAILISFLLASLGTVFLTWRICIVGDENGVRWRNWRGVWRAAQWNEISDFYLLQRHQNAIREVQTRNGVFRFLREQQENLKPKTPLFSERRLANLVAARAIQTPSREWEIKGERLHETWPVRIEGSKPNFFRKLGIFMAPLFPIVITIAINWKTKAGTSNGVPFSTLLWTDALSALITFGPLLLASWLFYRSTGRSDFRGQSVEISPQNLVWNDGKTARAVAWNEISAFDFPKRAGQLFLRVQNNAQSLEIPVNFDHFSTILRLFERFSKRPANDDYWDATEALAPLETEAGGTLIFRYDTRESRIMRRAVWFVLPVFAALPLLFLFVDSERSFRAANHVGLWTILAILAISLILHAIFARFAQLRVSERGLEWRWLLLNRVWNWQEIEDAHFGTDGSWLQIHGRKHKLAPVFWNCAHFRRLRREIESRVALTSRRVQF